MRFTRTLPHMSAPAVQKLLSNAFLYAGVILTQTCRLQTEAADEPMMIHGHTRMEVEDVLDKL